MERIRVPRLRPGRPRTTPDSVSADTAYSNRRTRRYLRRRGIRHVIPEKSDQAVNRVRRGRAGDRPPGFDKERYKKRNTVERAINKLKNNCAVSTRDDKRAYVYLGTVTVAATIIWLRTWSTFDTYGMTSTRSIPNVAQRPARARSAASGRSCPKRPTPRCAAPKAIDFDAPAADLTIRGQPALKVTAMRAAEGCPYVVRPTRGWCRRRRPLPRIAFPGPPCHGE